MTHRIQLTYDEIISKLEIKNVPASTIEYTKPRGEYETSDNNIIIKSLLPDG